MVDIQRSCILELSYEADMKSVSQKYSFLFFE